MKLFAIVGCGGFGREVIPLARSMLNQQVDDYELVFVDDKHAGTVVNGHKVFSYLEFVALPNKEKYFNVAIANSSIRQKLVESLSAYGVIPFSITALNNVNLDKNQIGIGGIFCPFTTITSNATIGKFFHANIYSYIAHDCILGDYVTFAPNVHCNGKVIIEDHVYVGTGVIIREGTEAKPMIIGKHSVLGMGAVVTKSVAAHTTVIGNPAKPIERKILT